MPNKVVFDIGIFDTQNYDFTSKFQNLTLFKYPNFVLSKGPNGASINFTVIPNFTDGPMNVYIKKMGADFYFKNAEAKNLQPFHLNFIKAQEMVLNDNLTMEPFRI